jgi:type 1 glutamine amidotransferase
MKKPAMKYIVLSLLLLVHLSFAASTAFAQGAFKVLHFTKTSGWDHKTRDVSLSMFRNLGAANNFTTDHDNTGAAFNSLENLQQYAVVVFSNTSGNNLLSAAQRANFEAYINGGGSVMGIHAASDTYRHSSANGNNRGTWNWYAELIGASVQENPNHVAGTPQYTMRKIGSHPSTANVPNPWTKNEEYYYWEKGYYNAANVAVLEVEQTRGPNNQVNTYDAARPMSWYRQLPSGGRSFYTALGHAPTNFTTDQNFISHVRDAVLWAAAARTVTAVPAGRSAGGPLLRFENPVRAHLQLSFAAQDHSPLQLTVSDLSGRAVLTQQLPSPVTDFTALIDLSDQATGLYFLQVLQGNRLTTRKFMLIR